MRVLCRLFTPEIATFYEEFLTSKGITFMKEDTASSFEGKDGKARRRSPCNLARLCTPRMRGRHPVTAAEQRIAWIQPESNLTPRCC